MNRIVRSLPLLRKLANTKTMNRFRDALEMKGIRMASSELPFLLSQSGTILLNADLFLDKESKVQLAAAPLVLTAPDVFRRQPAWMLMGAAAALGCEGIAPLERFVGQIGFSRERMCRQYPVKRTIPWDERNMCTGIYAESSGLRSFTQGGPEEIIARCLYVQDGREREMTQNDVDVLERSVSAAREDGMDLLAFATRRLETENDRTEEDMTFLGLLAFGRGMRNDDKSGFGNMHIGEIPVLPVCYGKLIKRVREEILGDEKIDSVWNGRSLATLSEEQFEKEVRNASAFDEIGAGQISRITNVLSERGTVVSVGFTCEGCVSVSFAGQDSASEADVAFNEGSLPDLMELINECKQLCIEIK